MCRSLSYVGKEQHSTQQPFESPVGLSETYLSTRQILETDLVEVQRVAGDIVIPIQQVSCQR
jgi:hypothetical protein